MAPLNSSSIATLVLASSYALQWSAEATFPPCFQSYLAPSQLSSSLTPLWSAAKEDAAASEHGADDASAGSSPLEDVLRDGVVKMNAVMTPEFFASSASLKQMHSQIVKSVEIKKSTIPGAGMGLFARKNIKANAIVSFYPAHALGVDAGSDAAALPFVSVGGEDDLEHFRTHPSGRSGYLHCTDQPIFRRPSLLARAEALPPEWKEVPLYLDCNPNRPIADGAWVSQMINDGARVESNSVQAVLEYYRATGAAKNCVHIPFGPSPIMATVATKKVKKGQELFTSYGCTYWLGDLLGFGREGEAVGMTSAIQAQIQDTARDLFGCMESAAVLYGNQARDLQSAFDNIEV